MHKKTKPSSKVIRLEVLLFDQFSNHCLANTIEPFRAANIITGKTLYQWRFVSIKGGQIISSSGLPVATERLNENDEPVDRIFAMPSYGYRNLTTPPILEALKLAVRRTVFMVGLDTGAWILAAAGLLDGRRATIHSAILDDFSECFLTVDVQADRYLHDRNMITCGGAMAAFDLALHLIGEEQGELLKLDVEANFLYHGDAPDLAEGWQSNKSTLVGRALKLMDENLEAQLTLQDLSLLLNSSAKELQRRFSTTLNMTPGQVYRHKKLSLARTLILSTDLPVAEITARCGYENSSAMTRAFKEKFGTTPLALRLDPAD